MKISLDIKDDKADFVMEVLQNFKFVKIETSIEDKKARKAKQITKITKDLKAAFKQVKLHQEGKIKLKSLDELLDEI